MRRLDEVLKHDTIPMLRKRRKSLIAYRNKMNKDIYGKDEALQAQDDIFRIDDRITELEGKL